MRFRTKFGPQGIVTLAVGCLAPLLALNSPNRNPGLIALGVGLLAMAADVVLRWVFVYWDVEDNCLRIRRFRKQTEIAWNRIICLREWNRKHASNLLAIEYTAGDRESRSALVLASPEDRKGFIATLKLHAPQARFEIESGRIV